MTEFDARPPLMDWADLKQRLDRTEAELNALHLRYQTLEAQAFALVWHIPDEVPVGAVKAIASMLLDLTQRSAHLEIENAELRRSKGVS